MGRPKFKLYTHPEMSLINDGGYLYLDSVSRPQLSHLTHYGDTRVVVGGVVSIFRETAL